jgi:ankyrin repeat protein
MIATYLHGSAKFALARSSRELYHLLRTTVLQFNIEYQNSNLLGLAAKDDNVDLTFMLLHHGANVNAFFRARTPVMRALKYSSSAVLKLLLETPRLYINIQNREQESALWFAVTYGSCSTLRALLELPGCAVNLRHRRGQTAFHFAVWWGRIGLVEALLSNGGDPYAYDVSGRSPWDWVFQYDRPSMKAVFSREKKYVRPMYAHSDAPALHQAVPHGSVDAVKLLLGRKGLDLAIIDSDGAIALHLAVRSRRLEVVDLILRHPRVDVKL